MNSCWPRIIPVLLYQKSGLYKTVQFKNPVYVGDPINAVRIFNEKEVDELIFLDIEASSKPEPDYQYISKITSECFMPLCYGGGIRTIEQIRKILKIGVEKVSINTEASLNPDFIRRSAEAFGSSTIVASIDVKKNLFGKHKVYVNNGKKNTGLDVLEYACMMEKQGAGEILLNSVSLDGMMSGYDLALIKEVSEAVSVPVVACGGAGNIQHFKQAVDSGASAVAAGSMFVFWGRHRAVLINYPSSEEIRSIFPGT